MTIPNTQRVNCSCVCHKMRDHTQLTFCGHCWTTHTYRTPEGMIKLRENPDDYPATYARTMAFPSSEAPECDLGEALRLRHT